MPRRSLAALATSAAGLLALAWVLWGLHSVFVREREAALLAASERRLALEAYAGQSLRERLAAQLREAQPRIDAASGDPLLYANDLYLARGEGQLLPRGVAPTSSDATPARELYAALRGGKTHIQDDSPWSERIELLARLRAALGRNDLRGIERWVRETLRHRASYRIPATQDIPHTLALLDLLRERTRLDSTLLERILRSGFGAPDDVDAVPGVQRSLLRSLGRFTRADVEFLGERIASLSEWGGVRHDDFQERLRERDGEYVLTDPSARDPYVVNAGSTNEMAITWYIEPESLQRASGVRVKLPDLVATIDAEMRERGLLTERYELILPAHPGMTPLAKLSPRVESPAWPEAIESARSLYTLKSGLMLVCGVLAFGSVALGWLAYQRRLRLISLRSEFVAAVSHELRTPLASIRLQAETLARRLGNNAEARDYPQRIVRDIDGLSFLVENILSFNRLERGGWVPRLAPVSLRELVASLREELASHAARKLEIELTGDVDLMLNADEDLIRLLLGNLLRNAAQYCTREPACVTLAAERTDGGARIHVQDNGAGIARELWERVFEDFYRADTTGQRGSGLGLAIARRVMRAHGGEIRIVASSPEGTRIELSFPRGSSREDIT